VDDVPREDAVTSALSEVFPPTGGWTTDDLDELPEDGHRRELIDGVLIMTPSPTNDHQYIAMRLGVALDDACPDDLAATQAVEVRVNRRRSLIPDVLVTRAEPAELGRSRFAPEEVVLVIEIVSPGSQTLDRFAKPALYADAGIPHYWRVETDGGVRVYTYRLDPEKAMYVETDVFTDRITVSEPCPIDIPIDRLLPRHLRGMA
jgi:Uma2 family endonuclease